MRVERYAGRVGKFLLEIAILLGAGLNPWPWIWSEILGAMITKRECMGRGGQGRPNFLLKLVFHIRRILIRCLDFCSGIWLMRVEGHVGKESGSSSGRELACRSKNPRPWFLVWNMGQ